jgi:hypothetical protein
MQLQLNITTNISLHKRSYNGTVKHCSISKDKCIGTLHSTSSVFLTSSCNFLSFFRAALSFLNKQRRETVINSKYSNMNFGNTILFKLSFVQPAFEDFRLTDCIAKQVRDSAYSDGVSYS